METEGKEPETSLAAEVADLQEDLDAVSEPIGTPDTPLPQATVDAEALSNEPEDTQAPAVENSSVAKEKDATQQFPVLEISHETEDETSGQQEEEDEPQDDTDEPEVDYSHSSKKQLVETTEALLKDNDIKAADRKLNEIKPYFDEIENEAYTAALEKYLAEGGEKDGFEFKADNLSERFHTAYKKLKERKHQHYAAVEAEKEANLHARQALLEKLRNLVDSEETNQSISELKKIQQEWKSIGQAPRKHAKSLWASFNALVYRFYDNISIYYELKETRQEKEPGSQNPHLRKGRKPERTGKHEGSNQRTGCPSR